MTAWISAGLALMSYAMGRLRRDEEIEPMPGAAKIVAMISAALSAGCVAFSLRHLSFHPGESIAVALAWALSGMVWRGAMGRWRDAVGAFLAALSLAMAAYWYNDRLAVEWLLTAILVASYLAVLDMLGMAYVIGLLALARMHAPEAFLMPGFGTKLLAACLPGAVTWLVLAQMRSASRGGNQETHAPTTTGQREAVVPGLSRYLRRINHDFGFLAAAAVIVGVPFMTNQIWPMAGVEMGTWLSLCLVTLAVGVYNLVTRPVAGRVSDADVRSLVVQFGALMLISPILLGVQLTPSQSGDAVVYLVLMLIAACMLVWGLGRRPRGAVVRADDVRLLGLQLLMVFPMAFGWAWMIKGIRMDAQWWAAMLLPLLVWVARVRRPIGRAHE